MAEIISGVYKIVNTITGDFYIGSSKNIKERWASHKRPSVWKRCPNNQMYLDMKKYGTDSFVFEILEVVEIEKLKEKEQQFIEKFKPAYNSNNAKGLNIERKKEYNKKYQKSDKGKKSQKKYQKSDKGKKSQKKYQKKYHKSNKYKEYKKESNNKYKNQLCCYNGETLTLNALYQRFQKSGVEHSAIEAKKYLVL